MEVLDEVKKQHSNRIGFGTRVGAALLDGLIAWIFGAIIGTLIGDVMMDVLYAIAPNPEQFQPLLDMGGFFITMMGWMGGAMLAGFIFIIIEALSGATPGKMMLGIKIANEDGTAANTSIYLKRTALKNISTVINIVSTITGIVMLATLGSVLGFAIFIGCFFVLGAKRQSFHDMIAKTAVFNKTDIK